MTKRLITLISPAGKTKEQLTNEAYEAVQKYFRVEKEVLAKMARAKRSKNPYIYMVGIVILVLAGYLYFSRTDDARVIESQQANASTPVTPQELAELKKDPSAPAWLKDAESCTWVEGKIFCKMKGE